MLLLLLVASGLSAQQDALVGTQVGVSERGAKEELAIFALKFAPWPVPVEAVAEIDREVAQAFVNLGRFEVIGMAYRLDQESVASFIETIRGFKEQNVEIPEQVQMGEEFFTQADLNRIVASFVVVVPSVTFFNLFGERKPNQDPRYEVQLETSFSFINVYSMRTLAEFSLQTEGSGVNRVVAARKAIDEIPEQLTYRIRSIPEFQLRSAVLQVQGQSVLMSLGRDMGVAVGDEYALLSPRTFESGTYTLQKGLLLVRSVGEDTSTATVVWADGEVQVGEELKEIPRLGLDTTAYAHIVIGSGYPVLIGARQSITRGVYRFRPFAGAEVAAHLWGMGGLPVNLYAGGEVDLYFQRFQFIPMLALGVGGTVPVRSDEQFRLTHVGGMLSATVSYLFAESLRVTTDFGYLQWFDVREAASRLRDRSYGGMVLGAGLSLRY